MPACRPFTSLNNANSKVISNYYLAIAISLVCCEVYFHKAAFVNRCSIFPFPPASLFFFPPFVSLFNIHKCNPLNLKSFPAHVNECNHKSMVAKPQEHMNKSAERKKGEKKGGDGGAQREEWNKTGSFFFTPQVSLYPENVIGLTRGVVVGSLA